MSQILTVPSPVNARAGPSSPRHPSAIKLSTLAVSVLLEEAELTPKPALVDRSGNGAHHDLDLARLRRSAHALRDGFVAIAREATGERRSLLLRERIGRIGRDMERRMMAATDGGNAHRGAIWALGLLVAAAAQRRSDRKAAGIATAAAALARLPDRFAPHPLSNGECARLRYGAAGARGEAQAAFPHAIRVGLPTLRAARARGVPEDRARLDALMAIMSRLDDTCLLHRGGFAALETAKAGARAVLAAGGTAAPAGLERLHRLHDELMGQWASPGGSADLLGVTLFLDRLEGGLSSVSSIRESYHGNTKL
jgi:triphosphoribosyl-dephospho-CoA synthase